MVERNICNESGCKAFCCYSPEFPPLKINKEKILEWFPDAVQTNSIELSVAKGERGVFYKSTGDKFIIKIIGYCPNMDENFGCKIYKNKPEPCENFLLGEEKCTARRLTFFLPPFKEWESYQG